jgi:methionine sulfoxide reductase heme-binding subunit
VQPEKVIRMSKRVLVTLKVLTHIACIAPFAWLLAHLYGATFNNPAFGDLGPDPTHTVTFFTGHATLRLLVLSLAITPVRRLSSRLSWLIKFRRMLGLYAFFYGTLHLFTYVGLYAGFNVHTMVDDISHRRYILAGLTAWASMVPLALTSTTWSIRKLGGKRWQALHRLAYVSAIAGVVHYWWSVKAGVRAPLLITITLGVLLAARPAYAWLSSRKPVARAA